MSLATIWIALSILLLVFAICGSIPYKPKSMLDLILYWVCSIIPQLFAPQLALASIVLFWLNLAGYSPTYAVIINLITLALYAYVYWRGISSQTAVNAVIDTAVNRLNPSASNNRSQPSKGLLPVGFRPLKFSTGNVEKLANIAYGDHGKANLLDIYRPKVTTNQNMPVLLFVPGGGWVTGSKNDQGLPLLHHMATQGWLCVAINYRLGPQARFPAMLEDIFSAITWVKTHAQEYGGNPEFLAMSGNSAGGHLSSIATLAHPQTVQQLGLENTDISVNVLVSIYGRYDFLNRHNFLPGDGLEPFLTQKVMPGSPQECPDLWTMARPEDQINPNVPPILMVHGDNDAMIPVEEARAFYKALAPVATNPVDYLEIPGAQHAYDLLCSSWAMPTVYGIGRYLDAHYAHYLETQ